MQKNNNRRLHRIGQKERRRKEMTWCYCKECKHFKGSGICDKTGFWVGETVRVSDCPEFEQKED